MFQSDIVYFTVQFIYWLKQLIVYAMIGRIIISWLSMGQRRPSGKLAYFLYDVTEPFLNIARKIPHRIGMIDISPIIAIFSIEIITTLLITLLYQL